MSPYDALALSLLTVMTVGVVACAVYLGRLSELRADADVRRSAEILSWDGTGGDAK